MDVCSTACVCERPAERPPPVLEAEVTGAIVKVAEHPNLDSLPAEFKYFRGSWVASSYCTELGRRAFVVVLKTDHSNHLANLSYAIIMA